jgi:hypothetical protein
MGTQLQLTKLQKKCRMINVIIADKAKALHFVGQMYKSDYFMEDQKTKYKMQLDANKVLGFYNILDGKVQ